MPTQITVSKFANCSHPTSLGAVGLVQATWDAPNQRVKHANANPLLCVGDEDIPAFTLSISGLPGNFVMWVVPQGSNYTSTALILANTVVFTLPLQLKVIETWKLNVDDPGTSQPGCQIWVKLKRASPPP